MVIVILFAATILGAALFPRQINCDQYPATITNSTSILGSPALCFSQSRQYETIIVQGSCMDLTEMVGSSIFIAGVAGPPIWKFSNSVNAYTVPNATIYRHRCYDVGLYRRPFVYMCSLILLIIPYQAPSLFQIETGIINVNHPVPCQNQRVNGPIPIVYEDTLNVSITGLSTSGFCLNKTGNVYPVFGNDFLLFEWPNGTLLMPSFIWNDQPLNLTFDMTYCTVMVNTMTSNVFLCTQVNLSFPAVLPGFLVSDDLIYEHPDPCYSTNLVLPNATGGVFC